MLLGYDGQTQGSSGRQCQGYVGLAEVFTNLITSLLLSIRR